MAQIDVSSRLKRGHDQMDVTTDPGWDTRDPVPQRFFKRARVATRHPSVEIATTLVDRVKLAQRALQENLQRVDSDAEQCIQTRMHEYCASTTGLRTIDGSRVFTGDEMKIVMRCVLNDTKRRNDETFQLFSDHLVYLLSCVEPPKPGELSYIS